MRLINVQTMQVGEHSSSRIPKYAILSHRWENEEVSFQDFHSFNFQVKKGYAKIRAACQLTIEHGLQYLWVDTCCIDKTSSAELSEAINSMYRWYSRAEACFAHLSDVPSEGGDIAMSAWFTRGWTLQELIAPQNMLFYDGDWNLLGTKDYLKYYIAKITGIDADVLAGAKLADYSVAQRMSWASARQTERIEDQAYCLLGVFDVNMAMLYGEGEKAFLRLQEEIIKTSDDQSIFAWDRGFPDHFRGRCGLLALSPSSFAGCQDIVQSPKALVQSQGFTITNVGLSIQLVTVPWGMDTYLAVLDCTRRRKDYTLCIFLERLNDERRDEQYARVQVCGRGVTQINWNPLASGDKSVVRQIYVRQVAINRPPGRLYGFWVRTLDFPSFSRTELTHMVVSCRDRPDSYFSAPCVLELSEGYIGKVGIIYPPHSSDIETSARVLWMEVHFDKEFSPICSLYRMPPLMRGGLPPPLASKQLWLLSNATNGSTMLEVQDEYVLERYARLRVEVETVQGNRNTGAQKVLPSWNISVLITLNKCPNQIPGREVSLVPRDIWTIDIKPLQRNLWRNI